MKLYELYKISLSEDEINMISNALKKTAIYFAKRAFDDLDQDYLDESDRYIELLKKFEDIPF